MSILSRDNAAVLSGTLEPSTETTKTAGTPETVAAGVSAARMEAGRKVFGEDATEVLALNNVSVSFATGTFTAIMGPSGSGKSTLMHCLAGLDDLTSGKVFIGEENVTKMNERERTRLRREKVGFIFQSFNLIPTLTAMENIVLPERLARIKPDSAWLDTVIDRVNIRDRLAHTPSEMSGGQQQRVAVARALVSRPSIIFADEPTGNVDSKVGNEILRLLRHAVDEFGQTIVMVSHDANAAAYADRVLFLVDGVVVDDMDKPTATKILDNLKRLSGD